MQKIAKNEVFKYFIDFEWLYRSDIACFDCIKWSSRIIHGIPRVQHNNRGGCYNHDITKSAQNICQLHRMVGSNLLLTFQIKFLPSHP